MQAWQQWTCVVHVCVEFVDAHTRGVRRAWTRRDAHVQLTFDQDAPCALLSVTVPAQRHDDMMDVCIPIDARTTQLHHAMLAQGKITVSYNGGTAVPAPIVAYIRECSRGGANCGGGYGGGDPTTPARIFLSTAVDAFGTRASLAVPPSQHGATTDDDDTSASAPTHLELDQFVRLLALLLLRPRATTRLGGQENADPNARAVARRPQPPPCAPPSRDDRDDDAPPHAQKRPRVSTPTTSCASPPRKQQHRVNNPTATRVRCLALSNKNNSGSSSSSSRDVDESDASLAFASTTASSSSLQLPRAPTDSPLASMTAEQRRIVELVQSGANVFFTGSAGTGKSFVLHALQACLPAQSTALTSTTGVTAVQIGGSTLHHWMGVGLAHQQSATHMHQQIVRQRDVHARWVSTKTLIIDEISMLDAALFELLDATARLVRRTPRPFGGLQLVLCGDFFQLPPVHKIERSASSGAAANSSTRTRLCFETAAWRGAIRHAVQLKQVHRQRDDRALVRVLNEIRVGNVTQEADDLLSGCAVDEYYLNNVRADADGIVPTLLVTRKDRVDAINEQQLERLTGEPVVFTAEDHGPPQLVAQLESLLPVRTRLTLRCGAQVMLLKNLSLADGLSNGARGCVTRFTTTHKYPVVRFANGVERVMAPELFTLRTNGEVRASRRAVPLALAWAISVHKSQGMSVDRCVVDLRHVWECGQAYVSLSRVRTLAGLRIVGWTPACVKTDPVVRAWYERTFDGSGEAKAEVATTAMTSSAGMLSERGREQAANRVNQAERASRLVVR